MPTEYRLDPQCHLVRSSAWGVLTEAESHAHYQKLKRDGGFQPSFRQLCDLRQVTDLQASEAHLRTLARESVFAAGTRRAFVAPDDLYFGLARMLQTFCELEGTEVGVFRTVQEAADWLGVPAEPASE